MGGWGEILGRVFVGGFGPEVFQGIIARLFDRIVDKECEQYIRDNKSLLAGISEKQWRKLRKAARAGKITLRYEEVIKQLSENRPDVLGTICTTGGGVDWLRRNVEEARQKLTS